VKVAFKGFSRFLAKLSQQGYVGAKPHVCSRDRSGDTYIYIRDETARAIKGNLWEEHNDGVIWNRIAYEIDIIYHSSCYSLFLYPASVLTHFEITNYYQLLQLTNYYDSTVATIAAFKANFTNVG